jgi:hypothetical protein
MYTSGRTIGTVLERLTQKVQIRTTKVLKKHKIIFGKRFLDPQSGKNDFSSPDLVACHTFSRSQFRSFTIRRGMPHAEE